MALLRVLTYPHPFLTTAAEPVEADSADWEEITRLIDNMVETMYANRGIGLAAVQVGVDKRIIVLDIPEEEEFDEFPDDGPDDETDEASGDEPEEEEPEEFVPPPPRVQGKNLVAFVNPVLSEKEGKTKFEEGCLSVPGVTAEVQRFETVRLSALDRDGNSVEVEADGLFAIALQHEIDHLDGVLFIDRLSRLKQQYLKRKLKKAFEAEQRAL